MNNTFKRLVLVFVWAAGLLPLMSANAATGHADTAYLLHAGDKLQVSVWREDNLQRDLLVLPDGSISFPLVGRVEVAGLSTPAVEKAIAAKLGTYISDPVVTVTVTSIDGNRVFVIGKVNHPGSYILSGPLTVLQALSLAGGFTRFADEGDIKVLRHDGSVRFLHFDYGDLASGKDGKADIPLQAGDVVLVP